MRWYANAAVHNAIYSVMKGRESIWVQFPKSGDKPFWARRARVNGPKGVQYWVKALHPEYNSIGGFFGTNIIDWEMVDVMPPPLRTRGFDRGKYKEIWNQYLTPKGCKERGLKWEDIWVGKSLLFDFDNPDNPLDAFKKADAVARYITEELNATAYVVFSGSKGFHTHVGVEDSLRITGVDFKEYKDEKDPLKKIGKIYAQTVVDISTNAGVSYANEDRSSNFRQGIVRCPYTIHPKTGQIVWPLDNKNLKSLRKMEGGGIKEIAQALHSWDIPNQSFIPLSKDEIEYPLTYITPEYLVQDRGMVEWSGEDN